MNDTGKKVLRTVLLLFFLFLAVIFSAFLNQILEYKLNKQEQQTLQTISDVLYGTPAPSENFETE